MQHLLEIDGQVPITFLPRWAELFGVKVSPMVGYCKKIDHRDRVPRGMKKKLAKLRPILFKKWLKHNRHKL